jgi:sugar-specific transcriptional regulator TrmB
MCKREPKDFATKQRGGSKVYGLTNPEVMRQRREALLREAELNRLKKALRDRKRSATSPWVSTLGWELARAAGRLRKYFRTPKNPD